MKRFEKINVVKCTNLRLSITMAKKNDH